MVSGCRQNPQKKQKKHAFKIHFRPFEVILDQLFFPFLGRRVVQVWSTSIGIRLFCDFPQNIELTYDDRRMHMLIIASWLA